MPVSTDNSSRVLMAIGSAQALLALGMPFAFQSDWERDAHHLGLTETWSGWSLARRGLIDHHIPIPVGIVTFIVAATLCLVVLAWLALERPEKRWPAAVASGVGAALLAGSVMIGNAVQSKVSYFDDQPCTSGWGLTVWRIALLMVVVAALRSIGQSDKATSNQSWGSGRPPITASLLGRPPLG